jgi:hypothetical protein
MRRAPIQARAPARESGQRNGKRFVEQRARCGFRGDDASTRPLSGTVRRGQTFSKLFFKLFQIFRLESPNISKHFFRGFVRFQWVTGCPSPIPSVQTFSRSSPREFFLLDARDVVGSS